MPSRCASRGFTLVELLVVIGIIGLLVALLMPTISKANETVRAILTRWTIKNIALGLENFKQDFQIYPPSLPREPLTGNKTNPASGDMPTGAANLVYYLTGPAGNGWGFAAGGLMPFPSMTSGGTTMYGGTATRTFGPYYKVDMDPDGGYVRYTTDATGHYVAGFLDGFKPAGLILYFRSDRDASGKPVFRHTDNDYLGMPTDPKERCKKNFVNSQAFEECVVMWRGTSYAQYVRQDYLLVSPGLDGRYGYLKKSADGTLEPCAKKESDVTYDDFWNWN